MRRRALASLTLTALLPALWPARSVLADDSDAWVATILARPLFAPDRRLPAAAAAPTVGPAALPRLSGVLVSLSDRFAIFADTDGKFSIVREGGRAGPWLVMAIAPDEVTVLGPGGKQVLRPHFRSGPDGIAAKAAPGALRTPGSGHTGSILDQLNRGAHQDIPVPPPPSLQSLLKGTRK